MFARERRTDRRSARVRPCVDETVSSALELEEIRADWDRSEVSCDNRRDCASGKLGPVVHRHDGVLDERVEPTPEEAQHCRGSADADQKPLAASRT
jgi:hypothetical protein